MNFVKLLILQLLAHLLSDFIFQTKKIAKNKNRSGFYSPALYKHVAITLIFSFVLALQWQFWYISLLIAVSHLLIDGIKSYFIKKDILKAYLFYFDQILHLIIIYFAVYKFAQNHSIDFYFPVNLKYVCLIFIFLLNTKPANIFIKQVFESFDIKVSDENEIPNAGKLIGIVERWLILVFVLTEQFEAVGFLLASKSILRYGETNETSKTEYVLIGTMLSFGIAITSGMLYLRCM